MKPGDRLICALIQPQPVGYRFKQWPLHITLVPWFRLDISSERLAGQMREAYVGGHAFEITVGMDAYFGYRNRKQVSLIDAPELPRLEGQSRRLLHAHKAWVVDEADKTRRGFRPHVTVQGDDRLHEGDRFICDRLYVIAQHGDCKVVEAEIVLSRL
jgi:2'-5' RNA ligase